MAYHHIRSWRRHQDWTKALHKREMDREVKPGSKDTYDNLHQYSKNKIGNSSQKEPYYGKKINERKQYDSLTEQEKIYTI